MKIRKCPDCHGKGQLWRPHNMRKEIYEWSDPSISSTACGFITKTLPEYYDCLLCKGSGRVQVTPI